MDPALRELTVQEGTTHGDQRHKPRFVCATLEGKAPKAKGGPQGLVEKHDHSRLGKFEGLHGGGGLGQGLEEWLGRQSDVFHY